MTDPHRRSLWRGRALALVGIVLVAFSLRSAVGALSPILVEVQADYAVPGWVIGLIGTAPPVCFALFGAITPALERRFGLERLAAASMIVVTVAITLRALAPNALWLLLGTIVLFAAVGVGNVVLPPLVKAYFPDRIGTMTAVYSTLLAVSSFVPPLVAVPVAEAVGLALLARHVGRVRGARRRAVDRGGVAPPHERSRPRGARPESSRPHDAALARVGARDHVRGVVGDGVHRVRVAARDPHRDRGGLARGGRCAPVAVRRSRAAAVDHGAAGHHPLAAGRAALSRSRSRRASPVSPVSCGSPAGPTALWVVLLGLPQLLFPLVLVLMQVRTRTHGGSVALSGFVQSAGYAIAAVFPFMFGVLHDGTRSWTLPLFILGALMLAAIPAGVIASRRTTVEDEWAHRNGRPW